MAAWVFIAAGLAAAWALDRSKRWHPTVVHTQIARRPRGPEWKLEHQPFAWPRTEAGRRAFVQFLARKLSELKLLPSQSITLFIAHTARETGYGSAVWGNNFGNEKQYWGGPWFNLAGQAYMAFETPEEGILHAVNRVRHQWPGPFAKLLAGDPTWYGDLGRAGYYESPPETAQAEYNGILMHVRRLLAS